MPPVVGQELIVEIHEISKSGNALHHINEDVHINLGSSFNKEDIGNKFRVRITSEHGSAKGEVEKSGKGWYDGFPLSEYDDTDDSSTDNPTQSLEKNGIDAKRPDYEPGDTFSIEITRTDENHGYAKLESGIEVKILNTDGVKGEKQKVEVKDTYYGKILATPLSEPEDSDESGLKEINEGQIITVQVVVNEKPILNGERKTHRKVSFPDGNRHHVCDEGTRYYVREVQPNEIIISAEEIAKNEFSEGEILNVEARKAIGSGTICYKDEIPFFISDKQINRGGEIKVKITGFDYKYVNAEPVSEEE